MRVHLPPGAQQGRLVGTHVLSDAPEAARASLPLEISLVAIRGKLILAHAEGCIDLVSTTLTRFTSPTDQSLIVEFHTNGEEVERVTVNVDGIEAVYIPGK
jgi:hypothetical protein